MNTKIDNLFNFAPQKIKFKYECVTDNKIFFVMQIKTKSCEYHMRFFFSLEKLVQWRSGLYVIQKYTNVVLF